MKWECLAISLDEVNAFIASLSKSRDPNEKVLRKHITDNLLPLLEKQEESRQRKAAQKERDLLNLEKLSTAKRSSRIAGKAEHQRQEDEAREAERKKQADLQMAKKEQEKWMRLEKERETRMMTREQRVKEREVRRILHEDELANLSEDSKKLESGEGRLSERHLKAEIERKKQALEELADDDDWIFDCICGDYGQVDDGTHSIACENCSIWQHSRCVGVSQAEAERDDFHFVCKTCVRRAEDEERAKTHPPIKIRFNPTGPSPSPIKQAQPRMATFQTVSNGSPTGSIAHTSSQEPNAEVHPPASPSKPTHMMHTTHTHVIPLQPSTALAAPGGEVQTNFPNADNFQGSPARNILTPYRNGDNSTGLPHNLIGQPGIGAFSPPHPYSPTSLPPPSEVHPAANGYISSYHGPSKAEQIQAYPEAKLGQHGSILDLPLKAAPGLPVSPSGHYRSPPPGHSEDHRRSSINIPSPLSSAPILTPSNKVDAPANVSMSVSPIPRPNQVYNTPQRLAPSPSQTNPDKGADPGHISVLPPVATGLSPTKHSPPPRVSLSGTFVPVTPSILPPVASLSPSPRLENPTPPVKPSEPDRTRQHRQSVALAEGHT